MPAVERAQGIEVAPVEGEHHRVRYWSARTTSDASAIPMP